MNFKNTLLVGRNTNQINSPLADVIINNPESKMRVSIKEVEERVKDETKMRKINAPSTIEEKLLLNI